MLGYFPWPMNCDIVVAAQVVMCYKKCSVPAAGEDSSCQEALLCMQYVFFLMINWFMSIQVSGHRLVCECYVSMLGKAP